MSKHTPGPWAVDSTAPFVIHEAADKDRKIAYLGPRDCECNAHLIAAAPDLLDDLTEAAVTLRRYEALHRAKNTDESTAKAEVNAAIATRFEATIAKARGEA